MIRSGLYPRLPVLHGTLYAYSEGCRCDECREAATKKRRETRQRQQARQQQANG